MSIKQNSEILFLYDARLCNPNGDPDEENKPRMDYESGRNIVSDVRLKRYLRDYWLTLNDEDWNRLGYEIPQDIWVKRIEEDGHGVTVSAKQRIEMLAQEYTKGKKAKGLSKDPKFIEYLKSRLIDFRLFGATMPIGGEKSGTSLTFTGPVQFSWGYSLNRAEILPSSTITSTFAGREQGEKGEYGTFGKDWRIKYSFLAFWGQISAIRAKETGLIESDINLLDQSMLKALPLMATTRSKIGQTPRLYMRVEYKDPYTFIGDFRTKINLESEEGLSGIEDVQLNFENLVQKLIDFKDRIGKVVVFVHEDLKGADKLVEELKNSGITIETLK